MEKVLIQGDFNAHFDIKNASPCFAVLRRVLRSRSYYRMASAAFIKDKLRKFRAIFRFRSTSKCSKRILTEKVSVQGDFNAHFDIKNASPCFAVFYELEVTIAWQVLHL